MKNLMNILLIAPRFFDYGKAILEDLEKRYRKVVFRYKEVFWEELPGHNKLFSVLPSIKQKLAEEYNRSLINTVLSEQIDRILIVRGDNLLPMFFEKVKCMKPSLEIIHYQWDSLVNHINHDGLMISNYADRNYSFDMADCDIYPQFSYLPLFYTWPDMDKTISSQTEVIQDIDLLFLGHYYPFRSLITNKVNQEMKKKGMRFFCYIYIPLKGVLYNILTFKNMNFENIYIKKVSRMDYYKLLCRSKVILDLPVPKQNGATIRTIEALSLGCKMISTNSMLKREDFYSEKNIHIWDPCTSLEFSHLLSEGFDHSVDSALLNVSQWLSRMGI
jgi:hypothetical protein